MIIAVASGKGGTGKTLVASNLFRILSKKNESVALIDCDVEEPNVMNFISHRLHKPIVRYKIIRYKKFMPPDKPLYQ